MDTKEMGFEYSHINARMAGMKGVLLTEKDYELLLSKRDISSLSSFLKTTCYADDIRRVRGCDNIGEMMEGLNKNLNSVFRKTNRIVEGEPGVLLSTLLGWWDIYNIKIVLRGRESNRLEEEVRHLLVNTGTSCNRRLIELFQKSDLKNLIIALGNIGSPVGLPEAESLLEIYFTGGSMLLEREIERAYFEDALKKAKMEENNNSLAVKIIRSQIDKSNIIAGLKIINKDGLNPGNYYIDGGEHISFRIYSEILKDKKKLIERLHSLKRMERFDIKEEDIRIPERISALERKIEMGMLKHLFQTSLIDAYSIGVIIGYTWRKVNEVINLNTILHGRLNGIPNETIRELLVIM